jgi:hypothetical protein
LYSGSQFSCCMRTRGSGESSGKLQIRYTLRVWAFQDIRTR